jgi:multidrug resistance efflux pump
VNAIPKGQVIARIVNPEDERKIAEVRVESKLVERRIAVLDAKRIYALERYEEDKRLSDKKVISRDEFETSELSFRTLEEERRVLKAGLEALGEKLLLLEKEKNEGVVAAPIQGMVISDIQEKYGTYAEKGDFLLTLASPEQRLEFFLAEEDWGRVDVGDPARIKFYPLPGKTYRGRVVALKAGTSTTPTCTTSAVDASAAYALTSSATACTLNMSLTTK